MEKKEIIFLDSFPVVSTDGSWKKESLELYTRKEEELDKRGFEQARRDGYENAKLLFPLYKSGALDSEGFRTVFTMGREPKDGEEQLGYVSFVLKAEALPDDVWEALKDRIPQSPCRYSGCVSVTYPIMITYRDWYGSIGRSWECDLVKTLRNEPCEEIRETYDKDGAFAAGLKVFEFYGWKEVAA